MVRVHQRRSRVAGTRAMLLEPEPPPGFLMLSYSWLRSQLGINPLPNTVNLYPPALTGFQHQRPEERETTALMIALKARLLTGHRLNRKTPARRCFIHSQSHIL